MLNSILGLDIGTTSIGWALVKESQDQISEIIKLGVRVIPLSVDEKQNFEKGKPLTTNANRTLKRGARRNLQRFKLRRKHLKEVFLKHGFITNETQFVETGKYSTYKTLENRAKAAKEKISLEDFSRVLLSINKKRGYKSCRKSMCEDHGFAIDGMAVAQALYENNLTPGEYVFNLLESGKNHIPDFYKSDLIAEFTRVWEFQKKFYPERLTNALFEDLQNKSKSQTLIICKASFNIKGISQCGNMNEKRNERYLWRCNALKEQLDLDILAIVFQEINHNINQSSGYLGTISDRSKCLFFKKITVGEYLYGLIKENKHNSLKNKVFYRQDYLDEFERIWEVQAQYYSILTTKLKEEIRDVIIFYQRKLKSQKGLIGFCSFESKNQKYKDKTTGKKKERTIGHKVCPKSSPLFQEYKIWQNLNYLVFDNEQTNERIEISKLDGEIRQFIFDELNIKGDLKPNDILTILDRYFSIGKKSHWKCNFEKIEGNRTNSSFYEIFKTIVENEGCELDWNGKSALEIKDTVSKVFLNLGISTDILDFNAFENGHDFDKQTSYRFWHLVYSAEDDERVTKEEKEVYGTSLVKLKKNLHCNYGFKPEYAALIAQIALQRDYANLSAKAIKKLIPHLKVGHVYSEACQLAGYSHSNSLTKEGLENRVLKSKLDLVAKNSLRNPVVEKILNQVVNLVNQIIEEYGKPDEIRIELARELKKTAKQRAEMTSYISRATKNNEVIRKIIEKKYRFKPTKNDVIKYKLYEELKFNEYKTVFTNTLIPEELLFTKDIEIEHIIPKGLMLDDSFSNKTLAYADVNRKKAKRTALDFILDDYESEESNFRERVELLYNRGKGGISKSKYVKLLTKANAIPEGFINRDLNNTQFIAKKAKEMLSEVVKNVVPTTGIITNKLREDWDLINVMKELNLPKYRALGLTEIETRKGNKSLEVIKDWTKRNDHRHHAMDALTVAFTSRDHVQYINNLEVSSSTDHELYGLKTKITQLYTSKNGKKQRKFIPPMSQFRHEAKKHIQNVLISFKVKNKVVTQNINKTKNKGKELRKVQLTPRGQLHKETVYGLSKRPMEHLTKLNKKMSLDQVKCIMNLEHKKVILNHLMEFENNPSIAFDKKTLKAYPILFKNKPLEQVRCYESFYSIRKNITPDLRVDKVIDLSVKQILENRLIEFNHDPKKAFSNLNKNPIWLNKEKGIQIKRVKVIGVANTEALHSKKDHNGEEIHDDEGKLQPVDFVSTSNNHHVAIYKDKQGQLQERVVSFYEAVSRVNDKKPIVDKRLNENLGWTFLFTMKQNEMFVIPSKEFDPKQIDLKDNVYNAEISKHLYRVQKIATKNYLFRHHLETTVETKPELKKIAYINYRSISKVKEIIKVRINHIGEIIHVGEY